WGESSNSVLQLLQSHLNVLVEYLKIVCGLLLSNDCDNSGFCDFKSLIPICISFPAQTLQLRPSERLAYDAFQECPFGQFHQTFIEELFLIVDGLGVFLFLTVSHCFIISGLRVAKSFIPGMILCPAQ